MPILKRRSEPTPGPIDPKVYVTRALRRPRPVAEATDDPFADELTRGRKVLEETLGRLDELSDLLRELATLCADALSEPDVGKRAILAEKYEDKRASIPHLIGRSGGHLIVPGASALALALPGKGQYVIAPHPLNPDEATFHLPMPKTAFAGDREVQKTLKAVDGAFRVIDRARLNFTRDLRFLIRRVSQ